ncbi:hypothetical protein KILIM_094_00090 [Kineosphaera limosa NBRC 100340]|uniref:Glutaredoxin domain-containing protein n=1 Tax=Kineosphaera limosa NBRC 100340 TaxID=1184609 RepID=K6XGP2_9MICO|nr:hypothetical protein KILIM_094_00090 [Kineosphaera limosa NBRC 100340]
MLVATEFVILGLPVLAAPAFTGLALGAYLCSPLHRRPGPSHWAAQRLLVRDERPVVYWRPGCRHTLRLRWALRRAGIPPAALTWVDIWHDTEGAAYVRDLNDGAELVPTVILPDGTAVAHPDPQLVIDAVRDPRQSRSSPPAAAHQGSNNQSPNNEGSNASASDEQAPASVGELGRQRRPHGRRKQPGDVAAVAGDLLDQ